jgi:hypothetical protein
MTNPTEGPVRLGLRVERLWVWKEGGRLCVCEGSRPDVVPAATEYMRVLSREEVEKLASDEGVDPMQLINSLYRTIEGQRRHIAQLQCRLDNAYGGNHG